MRKNVKRKRSAVGGQKLSPPTATKIIKKIIRKKFTYRLYLIPFCIICLPRYCAQFLSSAQPCFQCRGFLTAAQHLGIRIVGEPNAQLTAKPCFQSAHSVNTDNGLAIDAKEVAGIELALYHLQCHRDAEKTSCGQVQPCILVFCADMTNVIYAYNLIPILIGDEKALTIRLAALLHHR